MYQDHSCRTVAPGSNHRQPGRGDGMTGLFPDTSPDAQRVQVELLRRAPAWRKLELLGRLNAMARTLALSGLQQRYPAATPAELRRRLADLLLGPELAARVYGPLPGEEAAPRDD
jgi:hypothetical protein